jgi:hypothetical protein
MESSTRIGGAVVVLTGLFLWAAAFLWMKYSVKLQIRGQTTIRRIVRLPFIDNEFFSEPTRWFGTIFIALMGLLCVIFGLVGLITGR